MAFWRAPGSILEAPGLDFGGSGDDFCDTFASFLARCLEDVPPVLPPVISPMLVEPKRQKKLKFLKVVPSHNTSASNR